MRVLVSAKLSDRERRAVVEVGQILKARMPVSRVMLFGSRARGVGGADSDIDLLVLLSCPVTEEFRRSVSARLAEIGLENDVALSSVVLSEKEWSEGLIRYSLLHSEVERDGCEI